MQRILNLFYKKMWNISYIIKDDIIKIGDYMQLATPIIFLLYSACFGTQKLSRIFVISFIVANLIQIILKALFNNPRPREIENNDNPYQNPNLNLEWSFNEGDSFPSGHTMAAMCGGIFWLEMPWYNGMPILGTIGIFLGVFTAISRIVAKAHWLRDVITSTIVCIIIYSIATYFINS